MRRVSGLIVAAIAVLVVASACARPTAPETAPKAPPEAQPEGRAAVAWPEWAFPRKPLNFTYRFDDGTPETEEQMAALEDRVVAIKEDRVYVTWFIRPDGVYRQDPLGGKDAPLLRYLPAEPRHDLVWSQTSGNAQIWFRLQEAPDCGQDYSGEKLPGSCWDLYMLNRGEVHFFRFAKAAGVVQAGVLSPAKPEKSFRKLAKVKPWPAVAGEADLKRWAGAAGVWADAKATPYKDGPAAEFERNLPDLSGFGKEMGTVRIFAAWGTWTGQGLLSVQSPYRWAWRPCYGKSCRHTWVPGQVPMALTETRHEGKSDTFVSGWTASPDGSLRYVGGFEPKSEGTAGEVQAVSEGQVTIRHVLGDPAGHTETRVYRVVSGKAVERVSTDLTPTAGELRYPENQLDLLTAAFVAKYYSETDELPRYFATPEAAAAFARKDLSPSPYGYRGMYSLKLGKLTPFTGKYGGAARPAVELTPAPVGNDGRTGFLLGIAYYEGGPEIWGQVRFVNEQGVWKIAELTIEGDQFVY